MAPKDNRTDKRDIQTLSLFVILALLTVLFVAGMKLVLFAPMASVPGPTLVQPAEK